MEKVRIVGVDFNNISLEDAIHYSMDMLYKGEKGFIVTPNSEIVYECIKNKELCDIIGQASLVLPDGIGIIYASKIYKTPIKSKVAGIDFASKLCENLKCTHFSLFLLGAKPGIAEKAADSLKKQHSGLNICGCKDGYFFNDEDAVTAINQSGADVVFVCLGAPKQEIFIKNNLSKMSAKLLIGLGGSLDVFAGEVRRAPELFIRLGLEWFYRLIKEPKRIGRMMRLPLFLITVAKDSLKGGKS
ncbi:MAG: WecB/TagA/CpsF family glycosyltransferase [Clostridiales bacterium]|nr:WecB/TagA/CpsF family glycosyltransferase [Clostridiales bacterium]